MADPRDEFAQTRRNWHASGRVLQTSLDRLRGLISQPDEMPLGQEGDPDPRETAPTLRFQSSSAATMGPDE